MWQFIGKYWATVAGSAIVAGCVALGVTVVGSQTLDDILLRSLEDRADSFVHVLNELPDTAGAMLTGISRQAESEAELRRLATLSDIDGFAVFSADGQETFSTQSSRSPWLLRDRAGGFATGNRIAAAAPAGEVSFRRVERTEEGGAHVLAPLLRGSNVVGFVSVEVEPRLGDFEVGGILLGASGKLLTVLFVAAGVPLLFYVRRKQRIAEASAHIDFLANHDPLTRLLNRKRMHEEVDRLLTTARATREEMLYCCIDIDDLSGVNDTLGQAQGDALLQVVANRLATVVGRGDLLSRIAGDDFALLVRRAGGANEVAALARRIRTAVAEPVDLKGTILRPQVSIGIARTPRDGRTHNEIVRHAQLARERHHEGRTGDFLEFQPSMDEETDRRRHIETLLRTALESDGFELAYQPLVDGATKTLVGFEALLRLRDEAHGYVSPAVFVPVAEERGYIKEMGTWVIREAARQAAEWPAHLTVSVNLSAVQFRDGDLVRIVEQALANARIDGSRFEVEVVESLFLDRTDFVLDQLRELKRLGVSIAMDDFGTGYSSLGYLWKFPFDKLKIDRSFMVAFEQGEASIREILSTIVQLAKLMHMRVTTEGVETAAQAEFLTSLDCDILQGFYFGKPMRPNEIAAELMTRLAARVAPVELLAGEGIGSRLPPAAVAG